MPPLSLPAPAPAPLRDALLAAAAAAPGARARARRSRLPLAPPTRRPTPCRPPAHVAEGRRRRGGRGGRDGRGDTQPQTLSRPGPGRPAAGGILGTCCQAARTQRPWKPPAEEAGRCTPPACWAGGRGKGGGTIFPAPARMLPARPAPAWRSLAL